MRRRKHTDEHWERIYRQIRRNQEKLMQEYDEISIYIPEANKWDYAIPENYTNYQEGFLFPDFESYRGAPIFDFTGTDPINAVLYIRWDVPWHVLAEHEAEKYLCFDRRGNKYTVTIQKAHGLKENPSYFRFVPKVKKYIPHRAKETTHG